MAVFFQEKLETGRHDRCHCVGVCASERATRHSYMLCKTASLAEEMCLKNDILELVIFCI